MCVSWFGPAVARQSSDAGPLAVIAPLLDFMGVEEVFHRHLPPSDQQEFPDAKVLVNLLAARLCGPAALVNVAQWARETGAEFLFGIPPDKLNDDRLGRALDRFFTQRYSILGSVAARVVADFDIPLDQLHFDATHVAFTGAYAASQPRPDDMPLPPQTPIADFPPAHITYGFVSNHERIVHVGVTSAIDDFGCTPLFATPLAGNQNGHTAVAEAFQLLQKKGVARFFTWSLVPLTDQEKAALDPPAINCSPPTHRLAWHLDQEAIAADTRYDGLSVLVTTAPRTSSTDALFSQFKKQCLHEHAHHQFKTPLAVAPVFLKNPCRVEALVMLLQVASTAYHLIQRRYRMSLTADATVKDRRTTTETILRAFAHYPLVLEKVPGGQIVRTTHATASQRLFLNKLNFGSLDKIRRRNLPNHPPN
jgi:Domain of unknown function (DUF4277)